MNKREGSFCDLLPVENIMHNDFECLDTITDMMDFVFFQMKLGTHEVNVSKNKSKAANETFFNQPFLQLRKANEA